MYDLNWRHHLVLQCYLLYVHNFPPTGKWAWKSLMCVPYFLPATPRAPPPRGCIVTGFIKSKHSYIHRLAMCEGNLFGVISLVQRVAGSFWFAISWIISSDLVPRMLHRVPSWSTILLLYLFNYLLFFSLESCTSTMEVTKVLKLISEVPLPFSQQSSYLSYLVLWRQVCDVYEA